MEIVTIIITGITSTVTALVTWYVKTKHSKQTAEQRALTVLLRNEYLRVDENKNHPNREEELVKIYEVYSELGGNSYLTGIHARNMR